MGADGAQMDGRAILPMKWMRGYVTAPFLPSSPIRVDW